MNVNYTQFYPPNFGVGYPPTPQNDFESDSPPNNFTFEPFRSYDSIPTPTNSVHGIVKTQSMEMDQDLNEPRNLRGRSSSEEKETTPAQNQRRKEQNRQAQRAFRERKERAFKDLEQKLATMEASTSNIMTENEILKQQLQKFQTENEILRATSKLNTNAIVQAAAAAAAQHGGDEGSDIAVGPMQYSPAEFYDNLLQSHANKTPSHRIVVSPRGEKLFGAGATWDLIVGHELFKQGLVDVQDVCDKLKGGARCDGQGPVYEESAITAAIIASAGSGRDEL